MPGHESQKATLNIHSVPEFPSTTSFPLLHHFLIDDSYTHRGPGRPSKSEKDQPSSLVCRPCVHSTISLSPILTLSRLSCSLPHYHCFSCMVVETLKDLPTTQVLDLTCNVRPNIAKGGKERRKKQSATGRTSCQFPKGACACACACAVCIGV